MKHKRENKRKSAIKDSSTPMGPPQKKMKVTPQVQQKPSSPYPVARDDVLNVYALIKPDHLPGHKQATIQQNLNHLQNDKGHCEERIEFLERQLSDIDAALACQEFGGLAYDDGDLVGRVGTANGERERPSKFFSSTAGARLRILANLRQRYGIMEANLAAQTVTIQAGTYVLKDQTIKLRIAEEEVATLKLQLEQTKTEMADLEHQYNEELSALKAGNIGKGKTSQLISAMAYDLFPTHIVQSAHPFSARPNTDAVALREAYASRTLNMVKGLQDDIAQRDETITSLRSQSKEEAERTRRMLDQHKKELAASESDIAEQKARADQLQASSNTAAAKLEEFRKFNGEQQALIERLTAILRRGGRMAS